MQMTRVTLIKLASFGGITAVAGACHYFGLEEHGTGLLGTALALVGAGAHAITGHWGMTLVENISEHGDGDDRARRAQNHDLHRMIGEAIARILEREAGNAPPGDFGSKYLKRAAVAFRGDPWRSVELTGSEKVIDESVIPLYFTDKAGSIKDSPVLEQSEWIALVERVTAPTRTAESESALNYAASKLREHFASELLQAAKKALETHDLAWPALLLRRNPHPGAFPLARGICLR